MKYRQISTMTKRIEIFFMAAIGGCIVISCATFPAHRYPNGMISYWQFEDTSTQIAKDSVGKNDGTLLIPTEPAKGIVGKAIDLQGTDFILIPSSESLRLSGAVTLEAWVWLRDKETDQHIISTAGPEPSPFGHDYYVRVVSGLIEFRINDDPLDSPKVVPLQQWFHVAATYDSKEGKRRIYVNGNLICENGYAADINAGHTYVTLGINARKPALGDNFQPLNGMLDEVAIYNIALSQSEILLHYENGMTGKGYDR